MINLIVKLILAMLLLTNLSACHLYQGEAIEGWVVDEETKQPLKSAVVTAVWEIYGGAVHQGVVGNLVTREAVTDDKGHFVLDSWGPKLVFWSALDGSAPRLIAFHRDYYFQITGHDDSRNLRPPPSFTMETRACSCNGKVIALKRFDDDWNKYAQNADLAELNLKLTSPGSSFSCLWERIPRLTSEILRRGARLTDKGIFHSLPTEEQLDSDPKCQEPKSILRAYK